MDDPTDQEPHTDDRGSALVRFGFAIVCMWLLGMLAMAQHLTAAG